MHLPELTLGERNSAFLTIVEWNAPGQKRLGLKKCLNNWLWIKRNAQLGGKGASMLSKSGPHGMSKRISSSGGLSLFATTAVGRTSIWGMRILPDWRTLEWIQKAKKQMKCKQIMISHWCESVRLSISKDTHSIISFSSIPPQSALYVPILIISTWAESGAASLYDWGGPGSPPPTSHPSSFVDAIYS